MVLRNSGTEAIDLQTNSVLIATVLYLSAEVASRFSGPYLATGRMIHLNPGEEASVPLMFSTTQEKDGAEVALSPGDYLVKVDLPIFDRRSNGEDGMERSYLSMPFADLRLVRHQ